MNGIPKRSDDFKQHMERRDSTLETSSGSEGESEELLAAGRKASLVQMQRGSIDDGRRRSAVGRYIQRASVDHGRRRKLSINFERPVYTWQSFSWQSLKF